MMVRKVIEAVAVKPVKAGEVVVYCSAVEVGKVNIIGKDLLLVELANPEPIEDKNQLPPPKDEDNAT